MKSRKKIALFTPTLSGGGAERMMIDIANELVKENYTVDLLFVSLAGGDYLSVVDEKINLIDFSCKRMRYVMLRLSSYLRYERPDVIISTQFHANIALAICSTLVNYKGKIIFRLANMLDILVKDPSFIRTYVTEKSIPLSYKKADFIVAQTEIMRDEVLNNDASLDEKTIIMPNFIDQDRINQLVKEPVRHQWLDNDSNKIPIILSAGRLEPQKDWNTLLRAFQLLLEQFECRLIILGEGPERGNIEKFVRENNMELHVSLPGFQINPFSWMARSDLFVLSTLSEGFPNVLIQSLACDCPVVSTDVPSAPREILADGKWGGLSKLRDYKSLYLEIKKAITNSNKIDLKQRANFYNKDKIIKLWFDLIEK